MQIMDIQYIYTNDLSLLPTYFKIYNVFPPFKNSMLKYKLFQTVYITGLAKINPQVFCLHFYLSKSGFKRRNFDLNMNFIIYEKPMIPEADFHFKTTNVAGSSG